jgi:molecular chaperone DnaJ
LNVSTDATLDEIKASFFELAKKYHPDSNPETSVDPEKFREIQNAYQTLSNPEKRKFYD